MDRRIAWDSGFMKWSTFNMHQTFGQFAYDIHYERLVDGKWVRECDLILQGGEFADAT